MAWRAAARLIGMVAGISVASLIASHAADPEMSTEHKRAAALQRILGSSFVSYQDQDGSGPAMLSIQFPVTDADSIDLVKIGLSAQIFLVTANKFPIKFNFYALNWNLVFPTSSKKVPEFSGIVYWTGDDVKKIDARTGLMDVIYIGNWLPTPGRKVLFDRICAHDKSFRLCE